MINITANDLVIQGVSVLEEALEEGGADIAGGQARRESVDEHMIRVMG